MISGLAAETTSRSTASVSPSRPNALLRAAVALETTISLLSSMRIRSLSIACLSLGGLSKLDGFGKRIRRNKHSLQNIDDPEQTVVIFRCKSLRPAMGGDQFSIY